MWSVIIGAAAALLVVQSMALRQRLLGMEQNIGNAMAQIGIHLSSLFDAMEPLLQSIKTCSAPQAQQLEDMLKARRRPVTAQSFPVDVAQQQRLAAEILAGAAEAARRLPRLESDANYLKAMEAVNSCGKMIHTGCLIYNDSVSAFNNVLRSFPISLAGHAMGFRRRGFIVTESSRSDTDIKRSGELL